MRKYVYICSPYRGDIPANRAFARRACRAAWDSGYVPVAPHLYFPLFLDDNIAEERLEAMAVGVRLLRQCCELWVCGKMVSSGMSAEITEAAKLGIPIIQREDLT